MNSAIDGVRRVITKWYRGLPAGFRWLISAGVHGETAAQQVAAERLREARAKVFGVPGTGDAVSGTVLHPHRSVVVDHFDSWSHLSSLQAAIVGTLREAGIRAVSLPDQLPPVVVVPDDGWDAAWLALTRGAQTGSLWVRGPGTRATDLGSVRLPPVAGAWEVFQYLAAPSGTELAGEELHVRVECWSRVIAADVRRPDGGTHEIGTLLSPGRRNTFASYLSPPVVTKLAETHEWLPSVDDVVGPIDIVYTWVDGSDPRWLEKRARFSGHGGVTADSQIAARYENRDELRYSLRSVEMFAGWCNRIYLVTDEQVPEWLNLNHPKLVLVDHRDIFEPAELPVFNSHAIESRLHRISGLSENFIYMNDDVFFGRPVRPELFFTGSGLAKFFPSKALIDPGPRSGEDVSVTSAAKNNRVLLERSLGKTFTTKLKHTPHAHSRDLLTEMEERFPEVFLQNVAAKFRTHADHAVLSGLAQRYGQATGRALPGDLVYNYADVSRPDLPSVLSRWARQRAHDAFCLNDTGIHTVSPESVHGEVTRFLNGYFPLASRFEVQWRQPA